VRRAQCRKEILHELRDEADPVTRWKFQPPNALPVLLGGIAGAAWALLFLADVAVADDCLRYVQKVKNFVAIPKDLLEDCMRTGSVQAVVTGVLGSMGGSAIAIAISRALSDAAASAGRHGVDKGATQEDLSDEPEHCGWCGAEMRRGGSICPSCGKAKEVCRNCGKKIWSAERDPLCPSCRMSGVKDKPAESAPEHCGWCGAEMRAGGTLCPSCNKGKEVCRNCGKRIWSAEPDPLCPSCRMSGVKDKPPEDSPEHCGWCGAQMPRGGSICPSCNKAKEACRICGKRLWSAERDPICASCRMEATRRANPPAPANPSVARTDEESEDDS
jgi:hypothetical protein